MQRMQCKKSCIQGKIISWEVLKKNVVVDYIYIFCREGGVPIYFFLGGGGGGGGGLTAPLSTVGWLIVGWLRKNQRKIVGTWKYIKLCLCSPIFATCSLTRSLHDLWKRVFWTVTDRQTNRQTDRQTDIRTLWQNLPSGAIQWKPQLSERIEKNPKSVTSLKMLNKEAASFLFVLFLCFNSV